MSDFALEPPHNNVVCVIETAENFNALKKSLHEAGYDEVQHLFGEDGFHQLDPEGKEHGLVVRALRAFQRFTTEVEERTLDRLGEALKSCQYAVAVQTDGSNNQKEEVRSIMHQHGGTAIFFSSRFSIELMEGW
ncbi:MAG: hypothetical protein QNJ45_02300 [Ardenticatenaceae bacterium]|nr:hypothetical protein [Ardenticatenaceae bacterium]